MLAAKKHRSRLGQAQTDKNPKRNHLFFILFLLCLFVAILPFFLFMPQKSIGLGWAKPGRTRISKFNPPDVWRINQ